jgi:hypothetical protein
MYRNTKMYDALMQMGRWFGYSPGYEDLCRVHLSRDSMDWYAYIARASEELVQQVKRMRRDKLSPKDFGLYVRSHPDSLLVTAANKMRSGEELTIEQSFSGLLRESYVLSTDEGANRKNSELIEELWERKFGGVDVEDTTKGFIFRDVDISIVAEFLRRFECHSRYVPPKVELLDYVELISLRRPKADVLLISPKGGGIGIAAIPLKNQQRSASKDQLLDIDTAWQLSKMRVASRGDEALGLNDEQKEEARQFALEGKGAKRRKKAPSVVPDSVDAQEKISVSDTHYRMIRKKPLLMIHSLEPLEDIGANPIPAFGVSFPFGDSVKVNAVVNKVWLRQMLGDNDDPDDEEDFDD